MLDFLKKLFTEQLKLSADLWLTVLMAVVLVAFLVPLIAGLAAGAFNKIKGNMKRAAQKPSTAVVQMKNMPATVKALYKTARMSGTKPSALLSQQVCVDEPYKHSLVSKIWLITLVATLICAALAYFTAPLSAAKTEKEAAMAALAAFMSPAFLLILGGLLTVIGGIIGKAAYGGAVKTYGKFINIIDGDGQAAAEPHAQPAQAPAYEAGNTYEPQAQYAEPATAEPAYEAGNTYEPQAEYDNTNSYDEPVAVVADAPQESDEDIRRRAREEAMAQARAQQAAAQAQAQAQARAQQAQAQQAAQARPAAQGGSSTADDVIAQIEKISREGAPRETMRDVATLLQKERAKPENKTPEQQKRLNDALSKLLKAMSAASKK